MAYDYLILNFTLWDYKFHFHERRSKTIFKSRFNIDLYSIIYRAIT